MAHSKLENLRKVCYKRIIHNSVNVHASLEIIPYPREKISCLLLTQGPKG